MQDELVQAASDRPTTAVQVMDRISYSTSEQNIFKIVLIQSNVIRAHYKRLPSSLVNTVANGETRAVACRVRVGVGEFCSTLQAVSLNICCCRQYSCCARMEETCKTSIPSVKLTNETF